MLAPIFRSVGCLLANSLWSPPAKYPGGVSTGDSGHYSPGATDFQRCVALLIADRLFQRKNNQSPAQTSDQNRRPIFVVSDLDCDNAAGVKHFDLRLEIARSLFNL